MSEAPADEKHYCSLGNEAEPMAGTADVVDVWLLLEYREVWRAKAIGDNELPDDVTAWVGGVVEALAELGLKCRPQFVRRKEISDATIRLMVARDDWLVECTGSDYEFLAELDVTDIVANPANYDAVSEPRYFVCTNGQRDVCCARFGLPVYRALRDAVGERAWQTTHVGGHRFAPNVLVLPGGLLYGRVAPEDLPDFVAKNESGQVSFEHLRGRCRYPQHVQAAEACLAAAGVHATELVAAEETHVTFATDAGPRSVQVRRVGSPMLIAKSCGDEAAEVFPFEAIAVDA